MNLFCILNCCKAKVKCSIHSMLSEERSVNYKREDRGRVSTITGKMFLLSVTSASSCSEISSPFQALRRMSAT